MLGDVVQEPHVPLTIAADMLTATALHAAGAPLLHGMPWPEGQR